MENLHLLFLREQLKESINLVGSRFKGTGFDVEFYLHLVNIREPVVLQHGQKNVHFVPLDINLENIDVGVTELLHNRLDRFVNWATGVVFIFGRNEILVVVDKIRFSDRGAEVKRVQLYLTRKVFVHGFLEAEIVVRSERINDSRPLDNVRVADPFTAIAPVPQSPFVWAAKGRLPIILEIGITLRSATRPRPASRRVRHVDLLMVLFKVVHTANLPPFHRVLVYTEFDDVVGVECVWRWFRRFCCVWCRTAGGLGLGSFAVLCLVLLVQARADTLRRRLNRHINLHLHSHGWVPPLQDA
eukprot:comp8254_c0_seq1/m.3680 comp8254_c0_seq1/g.3680  ORF comp8254_c0_seq1/g.3680 comp8254_c0_seq1/m.3680 type:complete len:300 (+) comp8254_c0_seq1:537-1436(+)